MNTAPDQTAPWIMPGTYADNLTVDGQSLSRKRGHKNGPTELKTQHLI
jgi:hypothetical protein